MDNGEEASGVRQIEANSSVRSSIMAWYALAILIVVTIFGFVDRQIIILVVDPIKLELGLDDTQIGAIQGLGPALFAVLAGFPLAWAADRVDRRILLIACILFWSAATAARGIADGFGQLLLFTTGIAVGEAVLTPVIYSLIPDLFPGNRRVLANFILFGSLVIGVGLGLMLGGAALQLVETLRPSLPEPMASLSGWRLVFFLVAAPGVLLALLVVPIDARRRTPPRTTGTDPSSLTSLAMYFRTNRRTTIMIYSAMGFYAFAFGVIGAWLPVAISRDLGAPPAEVGVRYGLAFTVAAGLGVVTAMITSPQLRRVAGKGYIIRAIWLSMALATVPLALLATATSPMQAYMLAGIAFFIIMAGTAYSPTMLQDMSPPLLRARVAAVAMILYAGLGASGPMVAGAISSAWGDEPGTLLIIIATLSAFSLSMAALLYRMAERSYIATVDSLSGLAEDAVAAAA